MKKLKTMICVFALSVFGALAAGCGSGVPDWLKQETCEHEMNAGEVVKAATCENEGELLKTCELCGFEEVETLAVVEHKGIKVEAMPAMCGKEGRTDYIKCEMCDLVLTEPKVIPALSHTKVTVPGVEATCSANGMTEFEYCQTCHEMFVPPEVIQMLEHTVVVDEGNPGTCETPGLTAGSHCSVCGVVMVKQEEVFGIHVDDDKNTFCDVCNVSITPTGFNAEVGDLYAGEPIVGNFYRVYRNPDSSSLNLSNLKDSDLERLYIDSKSGPYRNSAFVFNKYSPNTINETIVFYETDYIDFYFEDRIYANSSGSFTVTAETCFVEYGDLEIYRLNVGAKESCSLGAHKFAKWTTTVEPTCSTEGEKSRTCTLCAAQQLKQIETLEHVDADKDLSCDECNITLPETTHYKEVRKYDNTTDTVAGNWWRIYFGEYNAVSFGIRTDNTINISSNYYSAESTFGGEAYTSAGLSTTNVQYCQYQEYIDIYFDSSISYKSPNWDTGITVAETATFDFTDEISVYLIEPEG